MCDVNILYISLKILNQTKEHNFLFCIAISVTFANLLRRGDIQFFSMQRKQKNWSSIKQREVFLGIIPRQKP
jgi:hypothetical protein